MMTYKHNTFVCLLADEKVLTELANKVLTTIYSNEKEVKISQMKELLRHIDKNLFQEMKTKKFTLD